MAVKDRLNEAKNTAQAAGIVVLFSNYLKNLLAGIPLDRKSGEAEATIMLSPGRVNTKIYIVVLNTDRKITRVCQKYSAVKLGAHLIGWMKANGVDIDKIIPADIQEPQEPLNEDEL